MSKQYAFSFATTDEEKSNIILKIPHPALAAFVLSFSWIPWQVSAQIALVWPEKYCYI